MRKLILIAATALVVVVASTIASAIRVGPAAPADVAIDASFFNKITALIVPEINKVANSIVIPAISSSHFDVDPIHIENFDLGPITFEFVSPAEVRVVFSNLQFAIPQTGFELKDKILFVHVHCHGHLWASLSGTSMVMSMGLVNTNGKITASGASAQISWGSLNIDHKMDHTLCKIADKIVGLIVNVDKLIKDTIEKDVPGAIQKALPGAVDKAFAKLPFDITGEPSASADSIHVPIDLDSLIKSSSVMSSIHQRPPRMHRRTTTVGAARDLSIAVPASSANTVLRTLNSVGKLTFNSTHVGKLTTDIFKPFIPGAYTACPSCPLGLSTNVAATGKVPTVTFANNNASLSIGDMSIYFLAKNPNSTLPYDQPLFQLGVSMEANLNNFSISGPTGNVLHFDIGASSVSVNVIQSAVGKIDGPAIQFLVNLIIQTLVPIFNADFAKNGIPLPPSFPVDDLLVSVQNNIFTAGVDVTL